MKLSTKRQHLTHSSIGMNTEAAFCPFAQTTFPANNFHFDHAGRKHSTEHALPRQKKSVQSHISSFLSFLCTTHPYWSGCGIKAC